MSRVGMGMSGGAWFMDPSVGLPSYFVPQGISADLIATKYGFSRDDVDAYAVEPEARRACLGKGLVQGFRHSDQGPERHDDPRP